MENCLITKLKGVVDNPNLPKFGEFRINFGVINTVLKSGTLGFTKNLDISIINGYLTNEDGTVNNGTTVTTDHFNEYIHGDGINDTIVVIPERTAIQRLWSSDAPNLNKAPFEFSDLKYLTALIGFFPNIDIHINGDVIDLPRNMNNTLGLNNNPGIYGNLRDIPLGVRDVGVSDTHIAGDLVTDFLGPCIEAGYIYEGRVVFASGAPHITYTGTMRIINSCNQVHISANSFKLKAGNKYDKWDKINDVWTLTEADADWQ